jgi:hypothetical protein
VVECEKYTRKLPQLLVSSSLSMRVRVLFLTAAYEAIDNSLRYAMRFIDVLKDDIHPMVMIQRPSTLDFSCALALVQEEALDSHKDTCYESTFSRVTHRPAYPLLLQ